MNVILITGGTGLVGSELISRLLTHDRNATVKLLVRAPSEEQAVVRVDQTLRFLSLESDLGSRVHTLKGDVTQDRLGLNQKTFEALTREVTHIVHGAATTRFDLSLDEAAAVNVVGTRHVLDLARRAARANLVRLVHISTAYVSGDRSGCILEEELECGQRFVNSYEHTKYLAEHELRSAMREVPTVVVRPCAIVGHSRTGRTRTFNVIYYPLKLLARGRLPALPGSPATPIDLVPVDYVADAVAYLLQREDAIGRTHHLTAGNQVASIGTIARLAVKYLNEFQPAGTRVLRVRFIPHAVYNLLLKPVLRIVLGAAALGKLEVYLPYLTTNKRFDTTNTMRALAGTGIAAPSLADYFENVVRYCIESNWGKAEPFVERQINDGSAVTSLEEPDQAGSAPALPADRRQTMRNTDIS